jgi:two-component system nitrogen regulation response regulator NtrX
VDTSLKTLAEIEGAARASHGSVLFVGFPEDERSEMELTVKSIGVRARWAGNRRQAIAALARLPSIVLVDLSNDDAFLTARTLHGRQRSAILIGVVAELDANTGTKAMRAGVAEILRKPILGPQLASAIERTRRLRRKRAAPVLLTPAPDSAFVRSAEMLAAVRLAIRAAAKRGGLVMIGEPGTGREFLARTIHRLDGQERDAFVVIDCKAAREGTLEAELFGTNLDLVGSEYNGYVPLTISSALSRAAGGTLFIKNIGEMPARLRSRLVRTLEHRRVQVDRRYFQLDVRLILSAEPTTHNGLACEDFGRITSFEQIKLPPLRRRREDIPLLANDFLDQISASDQTPRKTLTPAALMLLAALRWRGNADQLKAMLTRLAMEVPGEIIRLEDVVDTVQLDAVAPATTNSSLHDARARFERDYIISVLQHHNGRVRDAARTLGIQRTNLYRKLRRMPLHAVEELRKPVVQRNHDVAAVGER